LSEYSPGSTIGHKPFYDRLLNLVIMLLEIGWQLE
jgi:hypothetical protein